ncbi:hypothetical protein C0991_004480 [Blastosporella zonata]|nr:hypothetical protein C0991_004480 [Blastosporella zonata]
MLCPTDFKLNGYDAQMHPNVIGPFLLTKLFQTLLSTAKADQMFKPGIVTVASSAHYVVGAQAPDFNTFKCTERLNNSFLAPDSLGKKSRVAAKALDPGLGKDLWDWLDELTSLMVWIFHTFADVPAIFSGVWPVLSQGYFSGKPQFSPDEVPDQFGRTIIVTGGNSGIGKETARILLQRNANVYIACRSPSSAQEVIQELKELTGKEAKFLHLDLGDLASVKAAAEDFLNKEKRLHVLYNNAGLMFCSMDFEINGYDAQIHTNVIGHFLLTKLLLPVLLSTAKADQTFKPRIVTVASSAHYVVGAQALDFSTFKCTAARRKRTTEEMYAQSKFVSFGTLQSGALTLPQYLTLYQDALQIYPASYGAITQLWAGTAPEAAALNGNFLIPWARVGSPRLEALDPRLGKDLWDWLDEQVKDFEA